MKEVFSTFVSEESEENHEICTAGDMSKIRPRNLLNVSLQPLHMRRLYGSLTQIIHYCTCTLLFVGKTHFTN